MLNSIQYCMLQVSFTAKMQRTQSLR